MLRLISRAGKVTRISFNREGWRRPTGDASRYEASTTYNRKHGFGHEDWLFRSEWVIGGWRYAFIQGVNKSHARLVKEAKPFDLTLFTIEPNKRRRYVASIREIECLGEQQARDALKEFKRRGWYDTMRSEIKDVGGDVSALGSTKWVKHLLNVRFRTENVNTFPPNYYASSDDPINFLKRYQLYDLWGKPAPSRAKQLRGRCGSLNVPNAQNYQRGAIPPVECSPEHAQMQAQLTKELRAEYPGARVISEKDFVDISVETPEHVILFEIKSDLEPRAVIRRALGQILEYAFHPLRKHKLPVQLVIVGQRPLTSEDELYLARLRSEFALPLAYRVVDVH